MPSLYETLDHLQKRNIQMAIVTNGSSKMQNAKIDSLKLRTYMSSIIISEEVNVKKPCPEIFMLALSETHSRNKNSLYVGDNPSTDIIGAMNAGIASVWLSCGKTWSIDNHKPQFIIRNLYDIVKLI